MNIEIQKGSLNHLKDCEETLLYSELGNRYFSSEGSGKRAIEEGLEQGDLYVALESCCRQ